MPVAWTVAVTEPAVAVAVTVVGVSPVAHTQVSSPTTVAPEAPSFGFLSIDGVGIVTASQAARARVAPSTCGVGGSLPAGTHMLCGFDLMNSNSIVSNSSLLDAGLEKQL